MNIFLVKFLVHHVQQRPKKNELWPCILEKAVAKAYGSYENIIELKNNETLSIFTGCPYEQIIMEDVEQEHLWKKLVQNSSDKNSLVSCESEMEWEELENTGFQGFFSYSILHAKEVGNRRLVLIRNPFGAEHWKGDWHERSKLWNQRLLNGFEVEFKKGQVWLSWGELQHYFSKINIHYCRVDWKICHRTLQLGVAHNELKFVRCLLTVPPNSEIQWISLSQTPGSDYFGISNGSSTKSMHSHAKTNYHQFMDVNCILSRNGEKMAPISVFTLYKNSKFQYLNLDEGEYELLIFTSGRKSEMDVLRDVQLNIYSLGEKIYFDIKTYYDVSLLKRRIKERLIETETIKNIVQSFNK